MADSIRVSDPVVPIALGLPGTFDATTLLLGALLMIGALVSGLARRSFLSLAALYVLAGFAAGEGGLGLVDLSPTSPFVNELAIVALIVILFRDGLAVDGEMLQAAWHLPLRKLVLAMPLTATFVALVAKALADLSWTEAFLLGALLSPTDPVLSSSVVTNPRVPSVVRHSLNLESGLNDGLALPAVLAFTFALDGTSDFVWWRFVLQDVGIGFVTGLLVAFVTAKLMPADPLERGIPAHQKSLYMLGAAFAAYGIAVLPPDGNGLIAVFVAAIALGLLRPDLGATFESRSEDLVEIVKLGIFVVFGALLTVDGLFADGWVAVAIALFTLFLARPAAVFTALAGTGLDRATKGFMAWFGPKGVATMAFSILVLTRLGSEGAQLFNLAALTVFFSIILHGLSDTPGSEWIARREAARVKREAPPAPGPSGTPTPPAYDAPGGR